MLVIHWFDQSCAIEPVADWVLRQIVMVISIYKHVVLPIILVDHGIS